MARILVMQDCISYAVAYAQIQQDQECNRTWIASVKDTLE